MSDIYPPTPGSGNNSTDDLYASLLGEIGLAGRVPSSVPSEPVEPAVTPPAQDEVLADALPREDGVELDAELGGADYPLAPQVSRASFVAPSTDDARAYAASSENGDPFETTPFVSEPRVATPIDSPPAFDEQRSGPPTGAFTSPAAQNALPDPTLGTNGRPRPTFDEVLYGTAPGF